MTLNPKLPIRGLPVLEGDNSFALPWYRWLQQVQDAAASGLTPAQVEALIAAAIVPIQAEIDTLAAEIAALDVGADLYGLVAISELDGYGG
jgi:hypothetical protein